MKDKILRWLSNGQVGCSSKAMAMASLGLPNDGSFPWDPADFNRCLLLLEQVPEIKEHFIEIAAMSKTWKRYIDHWDDIEKSFVDEVGFNWSKGNVADKTYYLMLDIREGRKE